MIEEGSFGNEAWTKAAIVVIAGSKFNFGRFK